MSISNIEKIANKDRIAIVTVGYNRQKSLSRLLNSLLAAEYPKTNIPLVISIDKSGDEDLYQYVREFNWPYGDKLVNIQEDRLGLLKHIYQCGDLTKYFKAIVLLEDDLFLSPYFYSYVQQTIENYGICEEIAEISLYKNEVNGFVGLPVVNYQNGQDVFLHQDVSTWGECWTEQMWKSFCQWRDTHTDEDILKVDMPQQIKDYTRAWSKYYNAYVVDTGKHVLYPNVSLTTNFSDAGEHGGDNNSLVQVNLLQSDFNYRLGDVQDLARYDIYGNNEALYEWLGLPKNEVRLDLYGFFNKCNDHRYILSTRNLPYKAIKSYALNLRPIELNIKYGIEGQGITLYDTSISNKQDGEYNPEVVPYMLKGFRRRLLAKYMLKYYIKLILRKLGC